MIPGAHAAGVGVPAGLPADAARALAGRDVAVTAVRQAADTEPVTGLAAASSSRSSGLAGGQPRGLAVDPPPGVVPAADLFGQQHPDDLGGVPLRLGGGEHLGRLKSEGHVSGALPPTP